MSRVLVTGANGYLGTRLVADLLRDGTPVRAAVRSLDVEAGLREAVRRGGTDDDGLELVVAGITAADGWDQALAGVAEVYHLATPMHHGLDPERIVGPARDGVLHVLRAARDAGARRVVLTSSFAAVGYSPKPGRDYTEDDWTDPDTPGLAPYPRSKAIAERAAWDFVEREGGGTELVAINPTWIAGPTLTTEVRSSLHVVKALIEGTVTVVPRQRFGVADVRDVAELHITAMRTPEAAGRRYLALADGPTTTFVQVARLFRDRFGAFAGRVTLDEASGDEPPPLTIHNDRARRELGFRPRPAETTLVETVQSMLDLGITDFSPGEV
ncbi:NAD-dependent epimerase/dehydratase family protein [Dactylosporangium sp. CA-233914]|uniref:NAD-dependent epimerase/dehydratase family protein n=1 Tax=Dactylosporangium sp. CA-233914 TaxID=3239934 RepID=UPI003D8CC7D4